MSTLAASKQAVYSASTPGLTRSKERDTPRQWHDKFHTLARQGDFYFGRDVDKVDQRVDL